MAYIILSSKRLLGLISLFLCIRKVHSFPAPNGPYNTSLITTALTDDQRLDPFAPTHQPRALMVSIFTPVANNACIPSVSPYMDPITAAFEDARLEAFGLPSGIFESLSLKTCQQDMTKRANFPMLLFSPAAGTTRLFYSAIAQQIASTGYIVAMIDHPYDADIVVFPDNKTVLGLDFTDDQIPLAVNTRARDISFVLDHLSLSKTTSLPQSKCRTSSIKAGVFGHSLGGATSAEAMLNDTRLLSGVNLDGTFFGDVVEKGLDRPFLIFAHDGKNLTTDPSWEAIWPELTGWKRELMLAESAHYTFSDLPEIVDILGFSGMLPSEAKEVIGSISGGRAFEIVTTYVQAFFDMTLKGKKGTLLEGPDKEYPEVTFAEY